MVLYFCVMLFSFNNVVYTNLFQTLNSNHLVALNCIFLCSVNQNGLHCLTISNELVSSWIALPSASSRMQIYLATCVMVTNISEAMKDTLSGKVLRRDLLTEISGLAYLSWCVGGGKFLTAVTWISHLFNLAAAHSTRRTVLLRFHYTKHSTGIVRSLCWIKDSYRWGNARRCLIWCSSNEEIALHCIKCHRVW